MPQSAPLWLVAIAGEGGAAAVMLGLQAVARVAIQVGLATNAASRTEAVAPDIASLTLDLPESKPPAPPTFWRETVNASLLSQARVSHSPGGIGPILCWGSCLEPAGLHNGDFVWIHPTRQARDRDLVLVEMDAETRAVIADSDDGKRQAEELGGLPPYCIKALFSCGAEWRLVNKAGIFELGNCRLWPITRIEHGALERIAREHMSELDLSR